MAHTAPWDTPAHTAPWGGPPRGALATVQAIGDVQVNWEDVYTSPGGNTVYDAVGRDIRDHLTLAPPDAIVQMGDVSDGNAGQNVNLLRQRFNLFQQWLGDYDLGDVWKVMGNHDTPQDTLDAYGWAEHWGYAHPMYSVDLGLARLLVVNPTGDRNTPEHSSLVPVRPLTIEDVAWIDAELASDPRPTLLLNHAPLVNEPTANTNDLWINKVSTMQAGTAATDLLQVLDAHSHCVGWVHGHTHDPFGDIGRGPNVSRYNVGSRDIVIVDASAVYEWPYKGGERTQPVTFYVSLMDDGRTVDVRWRAHEQHLWTGVGTQRSRNYRATA